MKVSKEKSVSTGQSMQKMMLSLPYHSKHAVIILMEYINK